jgi:hypothetical protein
MIKILLILCIFSQLKQIIPNKKWEIEIVTKKKENYYLLTKNEPIEFSVEGPTFLRVYTRILWPKGVGGNQLYKVILQDSKADERIITLESEISEITKDKNGSRVSKWRSFYIEVPAGINDYKITHWASPKDTILLKFKYESPKKWIEISATDYNTIIESIEEEKIVKYYELSEIDTLTLRISGPIKLKVISRLNYDENIMGEQNYTILVHDNEMVNKYSLQCYKSEIITYKDRKDIVPSNAENFFLKLSKGLHTLKFNLAGTVAKSAAIRFLIEEK